MRHLSPRGHLDGIVVNPFASSCLVDGTQVYSLVGFDPSTSFMFIAPCADPRIRFYGYIELKFVDHGKADRHFADGSIRYILFFLHRVACYLLTTHLTLKA